MSKPVVNIYLSPNGKSTKILADHLAKVIDDLNKIIMINLPAVIFKNHRRLINVVDNNI